MTIHHATAKRAAKSGIILNEIDSANGPIAQAHWAEGNLCYEHTSPGLALNAVLLARTFKTEWPNLELIVNGADFLVQSVDGQVEVWTGDTIPKLGVILDATHDAEVDPEAGAEEDDRHEIVPNHYKRKYAERGNRDHCGDWLAKKLDGLFADQSGAFDADAFEAFLTLNNVDMSGKWASLPTSGQRGWAGRYRMNGRQKLELAVTRVGGFQYGDTFWKAPRAYLEELAAKHPKINCEWE